MKLSIITVNLNNLAGLEKTVENVLQQSFKDFEYLIIDGGSIDGCKEFIESASTKLTYWQSKKDKGIYDAMNQGIEKATGEYLLFLNSGDTFYSKSVLQNIEFKLSADITYGNLEFIERDKTWIMEPPSVLNFSYFIKKSLPHPSSFIKRELFLNYGFYNTNMKICADWAFFIDAICLYNVSYKHIPITVSSFKTDGISSNAENGPTIKIERNSYLFERYGTFLNDYRSNEKIEEIVAKYYALKNSRVRRFLSYFFSQLRF